MAIRVPLSIHWSWAHQGNFDYAAFRALNPESFFILNPDHEICRLAHVAVPGAVLILRNQPQGEQHEAIYANPVKTAEDHQRDWDRDVPRMTGDVLPLSQVAVCGSNETLIQTEEQEIAVCSYWTERLRLATKAGQALAVGAFGNGWPGNDDTATQKDTAARWYKRHFRNLIEALLLYRESGVKHFLNLHEYYGDTAGPRGIWGWQSGRFLQLLEYLRRWGIPVQGVPIRFGEIGFDRLAYDGEVKAPERRGWSQWIRSTYNHDLRDLYEQYSYYPSVLGAAVFGWDAQNTEWNAFDIRPCGADFVNMISTLRNQAKPVNPAWGLPTNIVWEDGNAPLPPPSLTPIIAPQLLWPLGALAGTVTQRFGEHAVDYSVYGLIGHNGLDIGVDRGTPVYAAHDGQAWVYTDIGVNGGYGRVVEVWCPAIENGSAYKTIYAHLSDWSVSDRATVKAGQLIGHSGSTGNVTGPHLHFGIKFLQGRNPGYLHWVDPAPFLAKKIWN